MVTQLCKYTQNHQVVHFNWWTLWYLNFISVKLINNSITIWLQCGFQKEGVGRGACVCERERDRLQTLDANLELVFILAKAGTDPNSAAWAAYYAHYYQQQAQPPPAAPAGAPTTTQTNGQGNYGNWIIYFVCRSRNFSLELYMKYINVYNI